LSDYGKANSTNGKKILSIFHFFLHNPIGDKRPHAFAVWSRSSPSVGTKKYLNVFSLPLHGRSSGWQPTILQNYRESTMPRAQPIQDGSKIGAAHEQKKPPAWSAGGL
jgi:hypothetical protein